MESGTILNDYKNNLEYTVSKDGTLSVVRPIDVSINKWDCIIPVIFKGIRVTTINNYAFCNCNGIVSVTIPESIISIGSYAFHNCPNLLKANISNGITSIEDGAFKDCVSLESLDIPDSVTNIGDYAFYKCQSLKLLKLSDNIKSIKKRCFSFCTRLRQINLPDKITEIEDEAFLGSHNIREIVIPEGVEKIGNKAFCMCGRTKKVLLPNSLVSIGDYAFSNCRSLEEIVIQNNLSSIGTGSFMGCVQLKSISVPKSVKTIGANAFISCDRIVSIEIPENVNSIGEKAFYRSGICEIQVSPNNNYYSSKDGILFDKTTEKLICCPPYSNMSNCVIPSSVKIIEDCAFDSCQNLAFVFIPKSVISIGNSVFNGCSFLTKITVSKDNPAYKSVTGILFDKNEDTIICYPKNDSRQEYFIPESVSSISKGAFNSCTNILGIYIPNKVLEIDDATFENCINLQSINLHNRIKRIGAKAFQRCKHLETLIIPRSISEIGNDAFNICRLKKVFAEYFTLEQWRVLSKDSSLSPLASVYLRNGLMDGYIECEGVEYCTSVEEEYKYVRGISKDVTDVVIKASVEGEPVKTIFRESFWFSNVRSLFIPESICNISGNDIFAYCSELTQIDVSKNNPYFQSVDGVLFNKTMDLLICYPCNKECEDYVIPNSVTSITDFAFWCCKKLKKLTIPESVSEIGSGVFLYSSIESIDVSKENNHYFSSNGALYEKNTNYLVYSPNEPVRTRFQRCL